MPGLVGATLRTGSYLAAMRGSVTYVNDHLASGMEAGVIKLKLFNLLLDEIGPRILQHGIVLNSSRLQALLAQQPDMRMRECRLDGHSVLATLLQNSGLFGDDDGRVKLKVNFRERVLDAG